ncbi:MAG: winged helix-turn-helix transcriptional regulator [Magnetospirillum gryphiswaldense]|nr:winged helix-turn-helix transcriptional regulator [Magnetospirillum gryphiswaldense]
MDGYDGPSAGAIAIFSLEKFFPYRLSVLNEQVSRSLAALYADRFDLTPPEWRAMAVLAGFQPLSANGICSRTNMDKVRVTRAVARMIAAGLVSRQEDETDRRYVSLTLTDKGMAVYDQILPLVQAREAEILSALSAEERAALDVILRKLTEG